MRYNGNFQSSTPFRRDMAEWGFTFVASQKQRKMKYKRFDSTDRDPLLDEVVTYANTHKTLTASGISTHFAIGFNRANRLLRQLKDTTNPLELGS